MKVGDRKISGEWMKRGVFLGAYVAVVPIIMESENQETIILHNVNYTDLSLKFLDAMQPEKTCLHEKALELYVFSSFRISLNPSSIL